MPFVPGLPVPPKLDKRLTMEEKPPPPATELQKILKQKEHLAGLRYSAAELDKMALQAEVEAARLNTPTK